MGASLLLVIVWIPLAQAAAPISLPGDGGVHPDKLAEWWYYNGRLADEQGGEYGYELVFFRVGPVLRFAHFAVTDVGSQRFVYSRAFFPLAECMISEQEMALEYGDLQVTPLGGERYSVKARNSDADLDLVIENRKEPLLVGGGGFVRMGGNEYSYYYSFTHMDTRGTLHLNDKELSVAGISWFDHQWGDFFNTAIWGWDWFAVSLENGTEYNISSYHGANGKQSNAVASIIYPDGSQETTERVDLQPLGYWTSPHTGRVYPSGYLVSLPEKHAVFKVVPRMVDQEMAADRGSMDWIDNWEGICSVDATIDGQAVKGTAYNEITGYPKADAATAASYSSDNDRINSSTLTISVALYALAPANAKPLFSLPFWALISAKKMQ